MLPCSEESSYILSSEMPLLMASFCLSHYNYRPENWGIFNFFLLKPRKIHACIGTRRVEYQDLPKGSYTFEVVAVDRDLAYSEVAATVALTVRLPYERIGLLTALGIAVVLIAWQAARIVQRDRRLQESNEALSSANKELFQANQALQRDRAVERIRREVQAMEQSADFEKVLSVLSEDLKAVGMSFNTCSIDVLDELVDDPSMAYFEDHGFRYTTFSIDPEGTVSLEAYHTPAPFPPVVRETVERFIAGEPWRGRSEQTVILEVPTASYGRLRITALDRQDFTEEEVKPLQDFATAIALGYARFLDFKTVEAAQQRVIEEMEKELQVAHDMQMSLLPESAPSLEGIDLSGVCIPANHVGGDYYSYVFLDDDKTKLSAR